MAFTPARLTIARKRRGLNKARLAELVDITPQSVTDYEGGRTVPSDDVLARLSSVLQFPHAFFAAPEMEAPAPDAISFRSMSSMTAAQRDVAIASGAIAFALSEWIDRRFDLMEVDVPDLRDMPPEEAAAAVREHWGIGVSGLRSVVQLFEQHGIRVFSLSERARELDAYSLWHGARPFCFLNTVKSVEHSRFDAAHELGHLVLHRHGSPQGRDAEFEADAFASAFLMPRSTVIANVPRGASLPDLIHLKRIWGVSVAALAHRAHKLGILSDWHYRGLCIEMGSRGYRRLEPEPITSRETSQVFAQVFAALEEDNESKRDVAEQLLIHTADLDAVVFGLVVTAVEGGGAGSGRSPASPSHLRVVK